MPVRRTRSRKAPCVAYLHELNKHEGLIMAENDQDKNEAIPTPFDVGRWSRICGVRPRFTHLFRFDVFFEVLRLATMRRGRFGAIAAAVFRGDQPS